MSYPDHISQIERRIIDCILGRIQKLVAERGDVRIRIHDEEEMVLEMFNDYDADEISAQIGHTDMTTISIQLCDTKERASVLLVHGNDEDVISDTGYSDGAEWLEERLFSTEGLPT